jgi:hypothetical protein
VSEFYINSEDPSSDILLQDSDWLMGNDSISFLESIFSYNYCLETVEDIAPTNVAADDTRTLESFYEDSGVDASIIRAAIEAYFDLASLALPVLLQYAFMTDYRLQAASPALVYAVACRGCPFLPIAQKWSVQQQLASQFRRVLLEARAATGDEQVIRLDDLEALALMVDFAYEAVEDTAISMHSQLGKLFLTHDSLVLLTLQYKILGHAFLPTGSTVLLHSAEERKRLLFWHVYGKDAFRTLERKFPSRIRDDHLKKREKLPLHEAGTYLDAILALAIIARKTRYTLERSTAKCIKALHDELIELYAQLKEWRKALPPHLQNCTKEDNVLLIGHDGGKPSQAFLLQRNVLLFLEHNCYMQIKAWVSENGLEDFTSMDTIMLDHLIEYETLNMVATIVEASPQLRSEGIRRNTSEGVIQYPLIDVAPSILRDICAGTSYWLSVQGQRLLDQPTMGDISVRAESQRASPSARSCVIQGTESFAARARTLMNTVAGAASHKDTSKLMERISGQLSSLEEMIEDFKGGR